MKKNALLMLGALVALSLTSSKADVLADWTFESSGLGSSSPSFSPGANTASTNFYAESGLQVGTAAAFGLHAGAATYTGPAGNGSSKSLSSATWAVGDYYEFTLSTLGVGGISVSYDQISSGTGPGQFVFQYSTDGSIFTTFGTQYTVLANSSPNAWSSGAPQVNSTFTVDLSSITALNNDPVVYFRLEDVGTVSAAGGTVASTGTDRVDNFIVSTTPVPEPSSIALAVIGGLGCLFAFRRRH